MEKITADMTIGEILEIKQEAAPVLLNMGMHCLGCALAHGETVGEAAQVHGADLQEMLEQLNNID